MRLLGRFSPEFQERHIDTRTTGDLVAVDTFFVGTLKGVGKVYLQSAIDCHPDQRSAGTRRDRQCATMARQLAFGEGVVSHKFRHCAPIEPAVWAR